jgi:hypothetical protein
MLPEDAPREMVVFAKQIRILDFIHRRGLA